MSRQMINGNVDEVTALRHRTKGRNGRNKYSKGQRYYSQNAQRKMPRDTIPEDYEQMAAPSNDSMSLAFQSALVTQSAAGAVAESTTASMVGSVLRSKEFSQSDEES